MSNELNKAIEQVKENNPYDYAKLYNFASAWIKTQMRPFTSEDFKTAFYAPTPTLLIGTA